MASEMWKMLCSLSRTLREGEGGGGEYSLYFGKIFFFNGKSVEGLLGAVWSIFFWKLSIDDRWMILFFLFFVILRKTRRHAKKKKDLCQLVLRRMLYSINEDGIYNKFCSKNMIFKGKLVHFSLLVSWD